jgi:hypothetical protein
MGVHGFNTQETADERWKPEYSIRAICVNVLDLLGHPNMNGGTPASSSVNAVLTKAPEEFALKTAECARLSREKAPQDVFERAARDKEQYDAIHKAYYIQLLEARRLEAESLISAQEEDSKTPKPMGEFETPSSGGR